MLRKLRSKLGSALFKLAAFIAPNRVKVERISPRTGKPMRKYTKKGTK